MLKGIYTTLRAAYIKLHQPIYRYLFELETSINEVKKMVKETGDAVVETRTLVSSYQATVAKMALELSAYISNVEQQKIAKLEEAANSDPYTTYTSIAQKLDRLNEWQKNIATDKDESAKMLARLSSRPHLLHAKIARERLKIEETLDRLLESSSYDEKDTLANALQQLIQQILQVLATIEEQLSLEEAGLTTMLNQQAEQITRYDIDVIDAAIDAHGKQNRSTILCDGTTIIAVPIERSVESLVTSDAWKAALPSVQSPADRIVPLALSYDMMRRIEPLLLRTFEYGNRTLGSMHPIRLAEQFDLKYPGSVLENGYPGSGNVLLLRILQEILAKRPHVAYGEIEHFFGGQASHAVRFVLEGLGELFQPDVLKESRGQVIDFDSTWFAATVKSGDVFSFTCRPATVYSARFWSTHEFLSDQKLLKFKSLNYDIVIAIRHPYDVIISNLNKFFFNQPEAIVASLRDLNWFESLAENIRDYFRQYVKVMDQVTIVRYEDLISRPNVEIQKLARRFNVEFSESELQAMWTKYGFQPLQERHIWRPGSGKWAEFFEEQHLRILFDLGFEEILRRLNYEQPVVDRPNIKFELGTISDEALGIIDLDYWQQYGKRRVKGIGKVIENVDPRNGVRYFATSENVVARYLDDDRFWRVIRCLT